MNVHKCIEMDTRTKRHVDCITRLLLNIASSHDRVKTELYIAPKIEERNNGLWFSIILYAIKDKPYSKQSWNERCDTTYIASKTFIRVDDSEIRYRVLRAIPAGWSVNRLMESFEETMMQIEAAEMKAAHYEEVFVD